MFRNLILYSLIIIQLSTLKVSNSIKDIIKTFKFLRIHILIIISHISLIMKRSLMFKSKFFLTHVLKTVQ